MSQKLGRWRSPSQLYDRLKAQRDLWVELYFQYNWLLFYTFIYDYDFIHLQKKPIILRKGP